MNFYYIRTKQRDMEKVKNITGIAEKLIIKHSKMWLSHKLGITRVTLNTRLEKGNWKNSEKQALLSLDK